MLQSFFRDGNLYGTVAARLAGVRSIVASRRNVGYWHSKRELLALRALGSFIDWYLGNSKAAVDVAITTEKAVPSRCRVIPNAIDVSNFENTATTDRRRIRESWAFEDETKVIGVVSNLRPVKRIDVLLQAAPSILERHPNVGFILAGEGPERPALERLTDREGLSRQVRFVGEVADVAPLLGALDVAVLCSDSESLSNALLEYMAAGLPIVATDVGGNGEAIRHEQTGLLVPPGDATALAHGICRVLENPAFGDELGRRARQKARRQYGRDRVIRAHEEFYVQVARARRSPTRNRGHHA